jgi:hypothetical protein
MIYLQKSRILPANVAFVNGHVFTTTGNGEERYTAKRLKTNTKRK